MLGCGKIPPESREPCVCGNGLGNPPPGIPPGFCHEARGCAAGSNGWHVRCVYFVDIGHSFRVDSSSALVNLISFRPCFPHPPAGTNGTTPCGVGNPMWPGPGVVRRPAQPRAVWHNVVDVGEGEPRMGVDGRGWAWMGVDGRGWAWMGVDQFPHPETPLVVGDRRFPSGNSKLVPCPIPLRESQRDSATKPGVAPPSARHRVHAQHINHPKGVVPGNNAGRLSARGRIRQNGQRDHGFTISQPVLCGVIKTFVPSAQPRCGCCKHPARTRGNAGLWGTTRWRWGDSTANGREYLKGHLCMSPSHLCSFAVHPLRVGPKNQLWPLALNWGCFWRASKAGAERGAWR